MVMGEVTVTVIEAFAPLPFIAVAVTWHVPGVNEAVYSPPLALMDPHVALKAAGTLVVNCWVAFSITVGVIGDKVNCGAAPIVSFAVALSAGPLVVAPVMVHTDPGAADAVNTPAAVMLPQLALHTAG